MGESKSLSFARDYVFWPSLTSQIKDKVSSCPICNAFHNRREKETLHPRDIQGLPWQVVGRGTFLEFAGQTYLLVTDFYSKYFEIQLLRQQTATCLINNLKKIFARFGIPDEVVSDNASQYNNIRNLFSTTNDFKQFGSLSGDSVTQQAHQSILNRMVLQKGQYKLQIWSWRKLQQKSKTHSKDSWCIVYILRRHWCIPCTAADHSRRTRTMLPTHRRILQPQVVEPKRVVKALQDRQNSCKKNYDKQNSRDLSLPIQSTQQRARVA